MPAGPGTATGIRDRCEQSNYQQLESWARALRTDARRRPWRRLMEQFTARAALLFGSFGGAMEVADG